MHEDESLRGLPRDILRDIKRAAYEAKVREMEDIQAVERRVRPVSACGVGEDDDDLYRELPPDASDDKHPPA